MWNRVEGELVGLRGVLRWRRGILKRPTEFTPEYSQFSANFTFTFHFTSIYNFCKSLLCSMFYELTCSRFTRLFVVRLSPCPEYLIKPYNAIFLKSPGSKDIKTDIPNCQIHKYTNTNSQIHEYSL